MREDLEGLKKRRGKRCEGRVKGREEEKRRMTRMMGGGRDVKREKEEGRTWFERRGNTEHEWRGAKGRRG